MALGGNVFAESTVRSVSSGPQSPDPVQAGSNATYIITVTRTGYGNLDVYLSVTNLPAGVTATFSPVPVHFTGSTNASATAQLVLSTDPSTLPGSYPFTIVADDGSSFNIVTNTATLDVGVRSVAGIAQMPDGSVTVSFQTPLGLACSIQATTNLNNPVWTTLCNTNSGSYNLLVFVDHDTSTYPCRFYRLVAP